MSAILTRLQNEAKHLSKEEKLELAHSIWQELQEISPEAELYWKREIEKRYESIKSGETRLLSLEDFQAKYGHLEKAQP